MTKQPIPLPRLMGVIHLPALPGSPGFCGSMTPIVERAVVDASTLRAAGFDAAIIENFGDAPFFAERVEPATVAAMAVVAAEVRRTTPLRLGINVLRNDARAAMGIAAASGAEFIRVNVHIGVSATDQGLIQGRAAETLRYRQSTGASVAILADVQVKHAVALYPTDIATAAKECAYRGLADGLIVTGAGTGEAVDPDDLCRVRDAVPDRPLYVGSGATAQTVAELLRWADGVIVGTAIKVDGITTAPVDRTRAAAFVTAARA